MNRLAQADACGGAYSRILLPNELQGFGRPGHQLAVKTDPVRVEPLPEPALVETLADALQELPLEGRVLEETTPRARVADPVLAVENPKPLSCDILASAH